MGSALGVASASTMVCEVPSPAQPAAVGALCDAIDAAPARLGSVTLVCVDGPAGAGKTVLAERLADELGRRGARVALVHLDDLYEGWSGLPGVAERLVDQVLDPLSEGRAGRWQRFDWESEAFAEWHDLPVPGVLVVEGCASADRLVAGRASLSLFVDAPARLRLRRGLKRDGEALRERWLEWQVREAAHFAAERTKERADVVIDGTAPILP